MNYKLKGNTIIFGDKPIAILHYERELDGCIYKAELFDYGHETEWYQDNRWLATVSAIAVYCEMTQIEFVPRKEHLSLLQEIEKVKHSANVVQEFKFRLDL
jgi:hypothetical protein